MKNEDVFRDISFLEKGQSRDAADALLLSQFNIKRPSLSSAAASKEGKAGSPHITERVLKDGNRYVTSLYGTRTDPVNGNPNAQHNGIDIAGKIGDPIFAYDSGTIEDAGSNTIRGKFVDLKLNNGYKVGYSHLNSIDVKEGQMVEVGDRIGALGSTGKSTGPHLHFSVRQKDGTFVNPDVLASLYTGPADETTTPMDTNSMDERVASTPASTAPAAAPTVLPEITVAATKTNDPSSIAFSQEQQGQHPFFMVNAPQTYSMQQSGQKQDVGPPITVTDTDPSNRFSQSRDRWFSSYFS